MLVNVTTKSAQHAHARKIAIIVEKSLPWWKIKRIRAHCLAYGKANNLPSGKYWPYRKPNNEPLYVNAKSNHPPVVIKHLPMNITERLSSIYCNKDAFNKSKPIYAEALKKSGFDGNMSFIDPATRKNKRKRIRKNIIWFNPPFDKNVTTNVA